MDPQAACRRPEPLPQRAARRASKQTPACQLLWQVRLPRQPTPCIQTRMRATRRSATVPVTIFNVASVSVANRAATPDGSGDAVSRARSWFSRNMSRRDGETKTALGVNCVLRAPSTCAFGARLGSLDSRQAGCARPGSRELVVGPCRGATERHFRRHHLDSCERCIADCAR